MMSGRTLITRLQEPREQSGVPVQKPPLKTREEGAGGENEALKRAGGAGEKRNRAEKGRKEVD